MCDADLILVIITALAAVGTWFAALAANRSARAASQSVKEQAVSAELQRRAVHEQMILSLLDQYLSNARWPVMRAFLEAGQPVIGEHRVGAGQYSNRDTEDFVWFFENVGRMVKHAVITIDAVRDRWLHDIELLLTNRSVVDYLMKARGGNPHLFKNLLSLGGELSEWVSEEKEAAFEECLRRIEHAKEVLNQPI